MYKGFIVTRYTNISIQQFSKMAMWPSLQHDWPWPIIAIDTQKTISIEYRLLLYQSSLELQMLLAQVYRRVESRKGVMQV